MMKGDFAYTNKKKHSDSCYTNTRKCLTTMPAAWHVLTVICGPFEPHSDKTASSNHKVHWLSGMAGTGTSSMAHSLCDFLDEKEILGASFFCARSDTILSDPTRIFPTIATMFARSSALIRSEICQVLENNPDAGSIDSLYAIRPPPCRTYQTCHSKGHQDL